jgi:pyrimidine-nucleoside phosphorylase
MRTVDLIMKKRNGEVLSQAEIEWLVAGYTNGEIQDYQMAAWAMAVYFQGMTAEETAHLTMAMVRSGDAIDPDSIPGIFVDKHSTGGVGDKTTLVVAPLVAAAGVSVAKMSGRGLGHTGGTVDKLESIPGFQVELSSNAFLHQIEQIGLAVVGQSGDLAPADKKLYALRDVTATVESIPLIAASIMSKKIASGARAIVLDVKTGNGAFMKKLDDAIALAKAMVAIGTQVGRKTVAIISDMNQPLGHAVGNANEVIEAIDTLRGQGPADLTRLSLVLGAQMLVLAGKVRDEVEGQRLLLASISNGSALEKFRQMIRYQGGNVDVLVDYTQMPHTNLHLDITASKDGYVAAIEAEQIGLAAMLLGAGRATKQDTIDPAVGVHVRAKVGQFVKKDETLATLAYKSGNAGRLQEAVLKAQHAFTISDHAEQAPPFLYVRVDETGVYNL